MCDGGGDRGDGDVTDVASTYVLCPHLQNQVSVNFRGAENERRMDRIV